MLTPADDPIAGTALSPPLSVDAPLAVDAPYSLSDTLTLWSTKLFRFLVKVELLPQLIGQAQTKAH
jgi:hypothetical protein